MGFFKDVAEHLGAVDKNLLAKGILTRGEVVSIAPTGMSWGGDKYSSANSTTVCKITVKVVGLAGHDPYEATALVPVPDMYIPELQQPGAAVAVRVNPTEPTDIAYDLHSDVPSGAATSDTVTDATAAGESVATKDGKPIVLDGDDGTETALTTHPSKLTAAEILSQGQPCTVSVLAVIPLDQTNGMGQIVTGLILAAHRDGKADVQAQIGTYIPPEFVSKVVVGAMLPARFTPGLDTGDDSVVPDWAAVKA
jgi:hypothetical protein